MLVLPTAFALLSRREFMQTSVQHCQHCRAFAASRHSVRPRASGTRRLVQQRSSLRRSPSHRHACLHNCKLWSSAHVPTRARCRVRAVENETDLSQEELEDKMEEFMRNQADRESGTPAYFKLAFLCCKLMRKYLTTCSVPLRRDSGQSR